ncbi:hypothetical protein B0H11DRAFT_1707471 [Mycena galericulata]|nr:hypothetical protein B0H11DRAFT_1763748 [Mycena galericulata]KAJ7506268.1 hypothetical protein B0H11DRAFT_1707471 [Mycena galericulata]
MIKTHGVMYGVGWHGSQEANKSLVTYAPKKQDAESLATFRDLNDKLPKVAALYRQGLACLFPGGATTIQNVADREGALSFADALDGISVERPFANSLTATKLGFCNFQHSDHDFCPIAYGKWWGAKKVDGKWIFSRDADHSRTKGGEFMWGAYGVGVDFANGLVEIFWRGQLDYHGTLQSIDEQGFTRFGTSIQITTKGINAMHKVWKVEELAESGHDIHRLAPKSMARITTAQDRIDMARARAVSIHIIFLLLC